MKQEILIFHHFCPKFFTYRNLQDRYESMNRTVMSRWIKWDTLQGPAMAAKCIGQQKMMKRSWRLRSFGRFCFTMHIRAKHLSPSRSCESPNVCKVRWKSFSMENPTKKVGGLRNLFRVKSWESFHKFKPWILDNWGKMRKKLWWAMLVASATSMQRIPIAWLGVGSWLGRHL